VNAGVMDKLGQLRQAAANARHPEITVPALTGTQA